MAGSLRSQGSWGPRGRGHPSAHPAREQGSRAAPAPGIRHFCGARASTEMGRTLGLWGAGHHRSFSLSSLAQASENLPGAAPSHYPGDAPWAIGEAQPPQGCSPTRLRWCHLPGCLWGVSPNTVPVTLACDTAQKCLFQCGRGDERQLSRSSQSPWGLGLCLPKQRHPGTGDVQMPAWPLSSPSFFGTSGPGAAALPCVFTPSCLSGLLRASELASLPKKRHRPAQGRADVPLPGTQGPARCHPCTEQGQHTEGPS